MPDYPWYEIARPDQRLEQGDFVHNCPIVVPTMQIEAGGVEADADIVDYDVVVMSQSCDLEHRKIALVLVCPVWAPGGVR